MPPNENDDNNEPEVKKTEETPPGADLSQVTAMIEAQNAKFEAMQQQILEGQKPVAPAAPPAEDDDDLLYSDPAAFKRKLREDITKEVAGTISTQQAAHQQKQNELSGAVAKLNSEYPELSNASSDLAKKAVEINNSLDASLQGTAAGARLAILQAASELGVSAKSKRPKGNDDDFTLSGGSGGGKPRKSEGKVGDMTLEFAKLLGVDTEDKKTVERLNKYSKRDNWGKYS